METNTFVQPPGGDIKIWMGKNLLGERSEIEAKKLNISNVMLIPGIRTCDPPLNEFMSTVERFICEEFRMDPLEFRASQSDRQKKYVICRQVFYFFVKKYRPYVTTSRIGLRYMKDHATIIHGIRTIKNLVDVDKDIRLRVKNISERIEKFYPV